MLEKTRERIERRFRSLPVHHIDTSIILELENTQDGKACRSYINKLGYNYNGIFSAPMLSEVFMALLILKEPSDKIDLFMAIDRMIKTKRVGFYFPKKIDEIMGSVRKIDSRIDPLDMEIFSCAVENKAAAFITLDKNLLDNQKLRTEFNIRIMHPKGLL